MNRNDFLYSKNFNVGHYAVRSIILYLREMFNANLDFGFTVMNDRMNKEESYDSLLITSKYDWEVKYRNKRPAIFISRGNAVSGVNGTQGQGKVLSISDNGETTTYSDLVSFPIVVECLSESDIESELLSSICSAFLSFDARPLRSLGLQIQSPPSQSAPQLFEKANSSFISSVVLIVQAQRQYNAKRIGLKALENIKFILNDSTQINVNKG